MMIRFQQSTYSLNKVWTAQEYRARMHASKSQEEIKNKLNDIDIQAREAEKESLRSKEEQ